MNIPKCSFVLALTFALQIMQTFGNMDKNEFIYLNIYEPYDHQINSFKETLDSALNSIHDVFQEYLIKDQMESQRHSNLSDSSLIHIQQSTNKSNNQRLLKDIEGKCLNRGFTVRTTSFIYRCNGQIVSKSDFEKQQNQDCYVDQTQREFCYCPFDFYGAYCERFNPIECVLESVSHPQKDCESSNPQNYVNSYGQTDQPCYHIPRDSSFEMAFRAKCQASNPKWNYEGIKISENVSYVPVLRNNAFQYELDTENIKASDISIFSLQFKFINWNKVFRPYIIETFLKPDQVTGSEDITFSFTLDSKFQEYRLAGRYYYELLANEPYLTSNRISGVLEDSNYAEPRNKKKIRNVKYTLYIGLTLVIVLVTFIFLKHKNIISWRRPHRKESYEPLIEMLDQSHTSHSNLTS
jgi:hypothetical protein